MTFRLVIYGASDDLIEIEGDAIMNEEFNVDCDNSYLLGVSDGTVLRVRYDEDGIWRFNPVLRGSAELEIEPGIDDAKHSDKVTLTGDNLIWVILGLQVAR